MACTAQRQEVYIPVGGKNTCKFRQVIALSLGMVARVSEAIASPISLEVYVCVADTDKTNTSVDHNKDNPTDLQCQHLIVVVVHDEENNI